MGYSVSGVKRCRHVTPLLLNNHLWFVCRGGVESVFQQSSWTLLQLLLALSKDWLYWNGGSFLLMHSNALKSAGQHPVGFQTISVQCAQADNTDLIFFFLGQSLNVLMEWHEMNPVVHACGTRRGDIVVNWRALCIKVGYVGKWRFEKTITFVIHTSALQKERFWQMAIAKRFFLLCFYKLFCGRYWLHKF